jgi:hypothetical protein
MESDYTPFVRAGYEGQRWGVQGEYWQLETRGSLDGSLGNSGSEQEERIQIWDGDWISALGVLDHTIQYAAKNDLSVRSLRVDLTRSVAQGLMLTVGFHAAHYKNSRSERVEEHLLIFQETFEETIEVQSRVDGWLYGPSVGLRGSSALGRSTQMGFSLLQSVLFAELDHEASLTGTSTVPFFESTIVADSALPSRVAVPVTDVRGDLTVDLGEHVSIGAFALLSVWWDVATARAFSAPLGNWEQPKSTLVFASFGPVVRVGF